MHDAPTVYLDHAATTPMVPAAVEALTAHLADVGNASSLHASGRRARRVVEESRETIARVLGCRPGEVVFTSGGTEADNLAVKGLYWSRRAADPARRRILVSAVEHHAVLDPVEWLVEHEDADLELVPVDRDGRIDTDALAASIARDPGSVALVSVMWANNEVGTVQPIADVVAIAGEHGIPVHSDAVQALGAVPVDFARSGVDAMSISGHKVGGPLGVGALVVRREIELTALVHGGGQERDVRSGTLDVPAVAGFAAAVEVAVKEQAEHAARMTELQHRLVDAVRRAAPDAVLNGVSAGSTTGTSPTTDSGPPVEARRLPGNVHFSFPGCEGDSLLMLLDARGIECSTGSACSAGVPQPSHVLLAMGRDEAVARSSLRFSLGRTSTEADVDAVGEALGPCLERARAARA